jgi:hypothetical protein
MQATSVTQRRTLVLHGYEALSVMKLHKILGVLQQPDEKHIWISSEKVREGWRKMRN